MLILSKHVFVGFLLIFSLSCCSKKSASSNISSLPVASTLQLTKLTFDNKIASLTETNFQVSRSAVIRLYFNNLVDRNSVATALSVTDRSGKIVSTSVGYENNDSILVITGTNQLKGLESLQLTANTNLFAVNKTKLSVEINVPFVTLMDTSNKFPKISDQELLTLVQKQAFTYFWEYAHPVSGMARERSNGNPETITSGGSGFGIMAIPVAIERNFITRAQGLNRMLTIVDFLKNKAQKFHGAFSHWINGTDGSVIPFSIKDDGADLVETSYLMAGLLTARQYFSTVDASETRLRNEINALWNAVEWSWFQNNQQDVLFWHWSPKYAWDMNHRIEGWNECLITYILAASANVDSISAIVYHKGYAKNGTIVNGNSYYGFQLPLGIANGGPLFWAQYSFLGINPNGLSDTYANYQKQVTNHSKINYAYCVANPKNFYKYDSNCWGLTASDIPNGYAASDPNHDISVIAPTAALSSFPFTPVESMQALHFFYYRIGDKIYKDFGFVDAFSLQQGWFANSVLAIDKGPEIIMIENYRSQLVWNLLTSCDEIKRGMKRLGFRAPYL